MQHSEGKREKTSIIGYVRHVISGEYEKRRRTPILFAIDGAIFLAALLFARSSFFFGSHPLAAAYLAVLPSGVWLALLGAIVGALTLGGAGVIYAMISMIIVFLRVVTSGGGKGAKLFSERLLLRMSVATIGGFIAAVYELLLVGFSTTSILFGITMILTPPILVAAYYGIFEASVTVKDIIGDGRAVFPDLPTDRERYTLIYFRISALVFIFFVSFALREYSMLGISPSYLFAAAASLLAAKRFGSIPAAAVGFVAALGTSAEYSAAFMLAGLAAGLFFKLGVIYALVISSVSLAALGAYIGGVMGIASLLPEYIIAASLLYPVFSRLRTERTDRAAIPPEKSATDMVGTMALAYKNTKRRAAREAGELLRAIGAALEEFLGAPLDESRVSDSLEKTVKRYTPVYNAENITKIATKVCKNERITKKDLEFLSLPDSEVYEILSEINIVQKPRTSYRFGEDLQIISSLVSEANLLEEAELSMNEPLTELIEAQLSDTPFNDGVVRAFGKREKHIILACRDDEGTLITSPELREKIAAAADVRLGSPQFFRRGSMALFECAAIRKYAVSSATATLTAPDSEVSGDVARCFTVERGFFFSVISDGMGTGAVAARSATLAVDLLEPLLAILPPRDAVMHLVNKYLSLGEEECSATVDIFELDLYNLEATFLKSGAAASYIRRGSSIFRIRSETAPLGLMSSIDTEKIRVGVEVGDYIIMMSDGVAESPEDAPWLLELLSTRAPRSPKEYAEGILAAARARHKRPDDMTVTVMRIENAP